MANDNIFSGLKVVDLASFIAGPSAAVILSDFGADVIKVEPPDGDLWRIGHKIPPQPQAQGRLSLASGQPQQARHYARSEISGRQAGSRAARQMGRRAHRQYAASGAQEIEARIRRCRAMESAADLCRSHRLRRKRTGRQPPGIRYHVLLGAQRLAVDDARCRRAADLAGRRQR